MTYGDLKTLTLHPDSPDIPAILVEGAMKLSDMKERVMFQTNNDVDDLGDFMPHLDNYLNEGYDRIVDVWAKKHVPSQYYPRLVNEDDTPNLPSWMHRYIADWATWLVYRNGNPQKQQRGQAFRSTFLELLALISSEGGEKGTNIDGSFKQFKNFVNVPA